MDTVEACIYIPLWLYSNKQQTENELAYKEDLHSTMVIF